MNYDQWRHYLKARLLQAFKKTEPAIAEYRQAYAHNPQFAKAAGAIGYLLAGQGKHEEARHWFGEAVRIRPNDAFAHFNLGFVLDKNGRREEAVAAFREAVRLNAKLDRAWYGLGMSLAALGLHQDAAAAFHEVTMLEPMNPHAWYALGMAYHHAHDPDKVKEVVDHLFRFDPVMTRQLIRDAERSDLAHMVQDLLV